MNSALLFDPNFQWVLAGASLLGTGAGVLGCFTFLRRRALLGDALAHATLPGVCLAFMLTGSKHPLVLLAGAGLTGWLGVRSVEGIVRHSRIKEDAALALTLSVFFGAGIVLLTRIQKSGSAAQAGLDKFLFGQAASLVGSDVWLLGGVAVLLIAAVTLAFKEFKLVSFDPAFAATLGWPVGMIEVLLSMLTVIAVTVGLQLVGVVLMAAMLVTPAAAARYWTDRLTRMVWIAGILGAASGAAGAVVSVVAPRMPTGPWIVVAATGLFLFSLLAAPKRGLIGRAIRRLATRRRTADENLLKTLYLLGEEAGGDWQREQPLTKVAERRHLKFADARFTARRLESGGWLSGVGAGARLTAPGLARARRIVRLHRLWEVYLTERLHLAADHVHEDAENIEHVITPEIELELERALARPAVDPHRKHIPYEPETPHPARGSEVVP